jgi:hypothetical protein
LRYRGSVKNTTQLFTLLGLANLLIAKRRLFSLYAQGASRDEKTGKKGLSPLKPEQKTRNQVGIPP